MRIAFVTQWFPPERGTLVAASIAEGLAARGHEVHVLTGFPNYPDGKLYDGYRMRPYRREQYSPRVTVHRAPLYPSHSSSALGRVLNYVSFAAGASFVARTRMPAPDVWLTYSSPATAALPALTAPRRLRAPSCLLIQDLWPDSVTESGFVPGRLGRLAEALLHRFCRWTYRRSTTIGIISPSMADILTERGVEDVRIHLVPNWMSDSHLAPTMEPTEELRRSLGLPSGRLFMYAGNMGELQGLESFLGAFRLVPDAALVLVGEGVARAALEDYARAHDLSNVLFLPSQPAARIGQFVAASDIQVVSLRDSRLLRATTPSKLQASMAAARPILASASGDVAQLVRDVACGIAVAPGDTDAAAEAIRRLMDAPDEELALMGRKGRAYYEAHFSPTAGAARLEEVLNLTRIAVVPHGQR